MAKGYVPLFFDTMDETQDLNDEEFGRLIRATMAYASGNANYDTIITGNEKYAFRFLKGQIDRNTEISNARAKAGASKHTESKQNKQEQTETKPNKPEQEKAKRFKPPTVEEVRAYCKERGNKVDAQRFVDFYSSKGWLVGKSPMKDWKSAVRNWERDSTPSTSTKTVVAQDYNQRDYDSKGETPEEMLARLQGDIGW